MTLFCFEDPGACCFRFESHFLSAWRCWLSTMSVFSVLHSSQFCSGSLHVRCIQPVPLKTFFQAPFRYVDLYVKYVLEDSIQSQFDAFRRGFLQARLANPSTTLPLRSCKFIFGHTCMPGYDAPASSADVSTVFCHPSAFAGGPAQGVSLCPCNSRRQIIPPVPLLSLLK